MRRIHFATCMPLCAAPSTPSVLSASCGPATTPRARRTTPGRRRCTTCWIRRLDRRRKGMDPWPLRARHSALATTRSGGSKHMTRRYTATHLTSRRAAIQLFLAGTGVSVLAACGVGSAPPAGRDSRPGATNGCTGQAQRPRRRRPPQPLQQPPPRSPPVAVSTPTPAAAAAGQPKSGGTLRVGVPTDIVTLDPVVRGGAPYESTWLTFDRLVTYDDKLKPLPMLAESWDVAPTTSRSSSTCARASPGTPAASSPATTSNGTSFASRTRRPATATSRPRAPGSRPSTRPTSTPSC